MVISEIGAADMPRSTLGGFERDRGIVAKRTLILSGNLGQRTAIVAVSLRPFRVEIRNGTRSPLGPYGHPEVDLVSPANPGEVEPGSGITRVILRA